MLFAQSMKLLLISQYFPPETGAGATRSESIVKYLSELDWEIDVVSELPNYPTGKIYDGYRNKFLHHDIIFNSNVYRVWVWANQRNTTIRQLGIFISFLVSVLFFVLKHPKKYDIIYATSPPIFAGIAGVLASKWLKTKFVFEVRDIWPDAAVDTGKINRKSLFFRWGRNIEKWIYRNADLIIPVTTDSEKIIKERCGNTPTKVITNGVDLDTFTRCNNPEEMVDEKYDTSKFRVGYVGSLGVIHDIETFINAAKLCEAIPDIEFVIVGDGGARKKLEKAIKKINPTNLTWLGLKEHAKIPAYISSFDVAINPVYDAEIFESIITVKFYEYLACGVPVISLARGLMEREGNKTGSVITIEPENATLLAEKITFLKENPHILKQMASTAAPYISKHYSRKTLTTILSQELKKFIAE